MRVLSGIQPSGRLHLGNYFSMMRRMIDYQAKTDLFAFIASYHATTTVNEGAVLREGILNAAIDFLALGIDPDKCTFWVQSDVPEVTELAWILSTSITVSQLELAHSYKDKVAQGIVASAGLFSYPVLMAADILLFGAQKVPVGKDQKQHLEITRDIAQRFNNKYGEVFVVPEPDILKDTELVPGVDGRKMSKSYNNAIYFFADEKELKKSVMSIVTDSKGVQEAKDPDASVLFQIYSLFLDPAGREELADKFKTPGTGYGDLKKALLAQVLETFAPFRKRRADLLADIDSVMDQLQIGARKARAVAQPYLERAREATGLAYRKK
ncbi:MAG: tryptophan--tRNA ligase [Spirochaetia bacterium]|nr:tryptophan--tRNA ligase [Spirochaetia bacterium]